MKHIHRLLSPVVAGVVLCAAPVVHAETNDELSAKVKKLEAELEALKAAVAQPKKPAAEAQPAKQNPSERLDLIEVKQNDAAVKSDIGGSFRIPGSELSIRPYGFAELDWVHVFNNDNTDSDYSTFAAYLPLKGSDQSKIGGRDYLTARESRLGLEAGMPTKYGLLDIDIEGDFNNEPRQGGSAVYTGDQQGIYTQQSTNNYGFSLRQAYGSFGGLTIGQTWSTFMDADNFPETVDHNGPVGATLIRQPQIRYAYGTLKAGTFTGALENSVTYVLDPTTGNPVFASASRMPDFVVRWDKAFEFGAVSLRAMTQELRIKGGGISATKRGYGVAASGLLKTRGNDSWTWGVTYGTGIGRYLYYIEGAAYDAIDNEIKLERALGGYLGYQFKPSDQLRFNLSGGFTYECNSPYTRFAHAADFDHGRFGVNRWVYQGHAGFFYTPIPATDFGLEAIYGGRETLANEKGDEFRLNFLARYYINYESRTR